MSVFLNDGTRLVHLEDVPFEGVREPGKGAGHLNAIDAGDLDGDGDLDLVVADSEAHRIGALVNPGDGHYSPPVHYPAGIEAFRVVVVDLNGDGQPEFASANLSANSVTTYFNQGDGTFGGRQDLEVAASPLSVAAGDLDGDGDVELISASPTARTLSLLENDGAGSFAPAREIPLLGAPNDVIVADLDADGDLDLATANNQSGDVSVFLNDGGGTFGTSQSTRIGRDLYSVVSVDMNSDGVLDLATVEELGTVFLLMGIGDRTFSVQFRAPLSDTPRFVGTGDINGDGFPDLAGTNRRGGSPLTVYLSQPRRVSREAFLATECSGGARFVRGDVDGDGELKLRDVLFLLNRLFQKGDAPACAKTADANDDGRLNIADALTMVGHLFGDRGALAEPSLACGEDPTPDALACRSYPLCEA